MKAQPRLHLLYIGSAPLEGVKGRIDLLVFFQPNKMVTLVELSDARDVPNATPASSLSAWATKRDWIQHRALIGQLYQDRTLSEVMKFMERYHGLKATYVFLTGLTVWIRAEFSK